MRLVSCLILLAATSFSRPSTDTNWETIPFQPDDAVNSFSSVDMQPVDLGQQSFIVADNHDCSTAPDAKFPGTNQLRAREGYCGSKKEDLQPCPTELYPRHLCCIGKVSIPGFVEGCVECSWPLLRLVLSTMIGPLLLFAADMYSSQIILKSGYSARKHL